MNIYEFIYKEHIVIHRIAIHAALIRNRNYISHKEYYRQDKIRQKNIR